MRRFGFTLSDLSGLQHARLVFATHQPSESDQVHMLLTIPKTLNSHQSVTESIPDSSLTPIWGQICRGLRFPSVPLASMVPGGINQAQLRPLRGSEVVFDPVGLLPDDDSKRSRQVQPASTLQMTNLDQTGQPGE